jgi:hypothetical protein
MTKQSDATKGLLKWCAGQLWDWMIVLPSSATATPTETEKHFRQWIEEIEQADGTLEFRWARITPRAGKGLSQESHVLVAGLSAGEWWWWTRRWAAINGDQEARGGYEYSARRQGDHLRSIFKQLLGKQKMDIEVRVGPKTIRHSRRLEVDEDGIPRKRTRR